MDASKRIDQAIASFPDWRGERLKALRKLIHEVDPDVIEEWKWMGTPVWNHDGILCSANAHKSTVRVTFLKGAQLADPRRVFNAELEGKARRAILWSEGDAIDPAGLKGLVRAAIALNAKRPAARKAGGASSVTAKDQVAARTPVKRKPAARK